MNNYKYIYIYNMKKNFLTNIVTIVTLLTIINLVIYYKMFLYNDTAYQINLNTNNYSLWNDISNGYHLFDLSSPNYFIKLVSLLIFVHSL